MEERVIATVGMAMKPVDVVVQVLPGLLMVPVDLLRSITTTVHVMASEILGGGTLVVERPK
jgi:hypothetical protein